MNVENFSLVFTIVTAAVVIMLTGDVHKTKLNIMQQLKQQHAMIVAIKKETDKTADPKLWTMEVIEKGCKKNEN